MARSFPLAGLLRLRHLQQDQAQSVLAAANARLDETSVARSRARAALGAIRSEVTSTQSLYAMAAARSSFRSSLADLDALASRQKSEAEEAGRAFTEVRAKSVGLEKLQDKHTQVVAEEELHAEQSVLDELASTAWHRGREGRIR